MMNLTLTDSDLQRPSPRANLYQAVDACFFNSRCFCVLRQYTRSVHVRLRALAFSEGWLGASLRLYREAEGIAVMTVAPGCSRGLTCRRARDEWQITGAASKLGLCAGLDASLSICESFLPPRSICDVLGSVRLYCSSHDKLTAIQPISHLQVAYFVHTTRGHPMGLWQ